jgi:hypothetical protein
MTDAMRGHGQFRAAAAVTPRRISATQISRRPGKLAKPNDRFQKKQREELKKKKKEQKRQRRGSTPERAPSDVAPPEPS